MSPWFSQIVNDSFLLIVFNMGYLPSPINWASECWERFKNILPCWCQTMDMAFWPTEILAFLPSEIIVSSLIPSFETNRFPSLLQTEMTWLSFVNAKDPPSMGHAFSFQVPSPCFSMDLNVFPSSKEWIVYISLDPLIQFLNMIDIRFWLKMILGWQHSQMVESGDA